jgi:glycosyltransferase involved in cell wall biosynthesis
MKVGIFLGGMAEGMGGEFTFQQGLVKALETLDTGHEIFAFYFGKKKIAQPAGKITYVSLSDDHRMQWLLERGLNLLFSRRCSRLQLAAEHYCIDIMWFPSPQFVALDIPYICTVLDLEHRVHPYFPEVGNSVSWQAAVQRYTEMIPRASYVITGTKAGKRQIVQFYHPDENRVRVIPFPVTPFAFEMNELPTPLMDEHAIATPYLFYPAQFWPHKNHVALLHALKLLRTRHGLDMEVVFCGSDKGNLSHVRATARELGVDGRVRFLGFVAQEELYALYKNAFALVYPSMFGPDNLPPLEAFAIGCPVVASNVAGAVEQLGDAALLTDPRQEEEIVSAVLRLQQEPDLRETLIRRGKERAKGWTTRDYVREIMALCDEFKGYRRCWSSNERHINL